MSATIPIPLVCPTPPTELDDLVEDAVARVEDTVVVAVVRAEEELELEVDLDVDRSLVCDEDADTEEAAIKETLRLTEVVLWSPFLLLLLLLLFVRLWLLLLVWLWF